MVLKTTEEILSEDHDNPRRQSKEGPCHPIQLRERQPLCQIMSRPHLEATHLHQQLSKITPKRLLEGTSPHRQQFRITFRLRLADIRVPVTYQTNHPSKVLNTVRHLISHSLKATIALQL